MRTYVHFVTSYRILIGLRKVPDERCTEIQNTYIMSNIFSLKNHEIIIKHGSDMTAAGNDTRE